MGDYLAGVPRGGTVPDGLYDLTIKSAEWGTTKTKGLKCLNLQTVVDRDGTKKQKYKGMTLFPMFAVGTEADPDAEEDDTWGPTNYGARDLGKLCDALGVETKGKDDDEIAAELEGQKVSALIILQTETEGPYKGNEQNRYRNFYPVGERDPFMVEGKAEVTGPKTKRPSKAEPEAEEEDEEVTPRKRAAASRRPATVEEDVDDDDEEEEDEEPAPKTRGRPPKAKVKAKPDAEEEEEDEPAPRGKAAAKRPADDDDDDDEDEEDEEPRPKTKRR
jgi:hypothetical protein